MESDPRPTMDFSEEYSVLTEFSVAIAEQENNGVGNLPLVVCVSMSHNDKIIGKLTRHYILDRRDAYALEAELCRIRFLLFNGWSQHR